MKNLNKQRKVTLIALSFALVIAVYLNWEYSQGTQDSYFQTQSLETQGDGVISEDDLLVTMEDYDTENYGDAQLVATNQTDTQKFFEQTRLSREKSRDEALDVLQDTLDDSKLTDAEKLKATESLTKIVESITIQTDIENSIKAKGFVDCVVTISDEKVSVAVQSNQGELTEQDVVKIRDVVLSKTSVTAQNIVVVEVN